MPPKKDWERIASLETFNEINMREHQELKDLVKWIDTKFDNFIIQITNLIAKQDEKINKQEDKFIMRREAWAITWAVWIVAVIIWIIINLADK